MQILMANDKNVITAEREKETSIDCVSHEVTLFGKKNKNTS